MRTLADVRNLLLNILIILFALFVYQTVWAEKYGKFNAPNHLLVTVLAFGSLILCTTFPIFQAHGVHHDFSAIPAIACLLYGDHWTALLIAVGYIFTRTVVSGEPWADSAVPFGVVFLVALLLRKRWETYMHRQRIGAVVAIDMLYVVLAEGWHVMWLGAMPVDAVPHVAVYVVVHVTVTGLLVHLY